jgi:hypothetical protein
MPLLLGQVARQIFVFTRSTNHKGWRWIWALLNATKEETMPKGIVIISTEKIQAGILPEHHNHNSIGDNLAKRHIREIIASFSIAPNRIYG